MSGRVRSSLFLASVLWVICAVDLTAYAAKLDPAQMCRAGTGRFATDYTVCTAAIASGQHTGTALTALYRHRALTLRNLNECSAALADIDKAIELTQWSVASWTERSKINQCLDRMPEALQDASKAIEFNEFDFESWRQLGITQFYLGQFDKAEQNLTRSIEHNSYNAEAYAFRGLATFGLERFEDAAWDFKNVADRQYAWEMNALWLAMSAVRSGRDPSASLSRTIEDMEGEWPAPLARWILSPDDSKSLREQAIKAKQLPTALFFMAQTALTRSELAQAKMLFSEVVAIASSTKGQPVVERVLARRALERLESQ